jgi:hypothetical protein
MAAVKRFIGDPPYYFSSLVLQSNCNVCI